MGKRKTVDISGMGGSYEAACQVMLSIGLEWIKGKPLDIWKGTGETCIRDPKSGVEIEFYGLLQTGEPIRELEKIWSREVGDITGAMHQAVLGHLFYIHGHGYDAWLEELRKCRPPGDFYEIGMDLVRVRLNRHREWARTHPEQVARRAFGDGKRTARGEKIERWCA